MVSSLHSLPRFSAARRRSLAMTRAVPDARANSSAVIPPISLQVWSLAQLFFYYLFSGSQSMSQSFYTIKKPSLWQCQKLCDTLCDNRNMDPKYMYWLEIFWKKIFHMHVLSTVTKTIKSKCWFLWKLSSQLLFHAKLIKPKNKKA